MMITILFLEWDSFGQEYIREELYKAGCKIDIYDWQPKKENMRSNQSLCEKLQSILHKHAYHFVFSLNFYPVAAQACNQEGTKYVSWVYDSPFLLLYSKKIYYSTNYVLLFDESVYREFRERGIETVYYLPMAAPVEYYDSLEDTAKERKEYNCEVSFVGSTYMESVQDFFHLLAKTDEFTNGYLEAIINFQQQVYGEFLLEDLLNPQIVKNLREVCPLNLSEDEWESEAWVYANYFLARHVTAKERVENLDLLSKYCAVTVFAPKENNDFMQGYNRGPVDYVKEMPLIFKNSKINLNMTLRSIHNGIPLRAMDIMGCGGFLLTNYQEDFLKYFEPDIDYVYYASQEELLEKTKYYLEHEDERKKIAKNGYQKVKESHTYKKRIEYILNMVVDKQEDKIIETIHRIEELRGENQSTIWHQNWPDYNSIQKKEIMEDTENRFSQAEEEKESLWILRDLLRKYFNDLLAEASEQAWEKIISWYNRKISDEMQVLFPEFFYLRKLLPVYIEERKTFHLDNSPISVFHYHSMEEIEEIFINTIFYLLRIEHDFSMDQQLEFVYYIRTKQISELVLQCILENDVIVNKEKVWNNLKGILEYAGR